MGAGESGWDEAKSEKEVTRDSQNIFSDQVKIG
jgi:hypothetical protein